MTPLVSVVVRSTARSTLGAALHAIAAQDHDNVEIVLADLVYNLPLLCREGKDIDAARRYAAHAASLAPGVAKYRALAGALG